MKNSSICKAGCSLNIKSEQNTEQESPSKQLMQVS